MDREHKQQYYFNESGLGGIAYYDIYCDNDLCCYTDNEPSNKDRLDHTPLINAIIALASKIK